MAQAGPKPGLKQSSAQKPRNSPWSNRFPGGSVFRAEVGPIYKPISKKPPFAIFHEK